MPASQNLSTGVLAADVPGESLRSDKRRFIALIVLCVAQLMAILDISIVNIALPTIQRELSLSTASLQWLVTGYVLTYGGFLLVGGRLGDLYGRRRMLLTGLVVFTAASALGGLSGDLKMLLAARVGQGLGAAILTPTVMSFIAGLFAEGHLRNKALGLLGAVTGAGFALGLVLGGLLTSTVGWRWVFFINLPIGVVVLVGVLLLLGETPRAGRHVNVLSALLATSGLALAGYVFTSLNDAGVGARTALLAVAVVALLSAFVAVERRSDSPLIPEGLLGHASLARAVVGGTTFGAIVNPTTFILTLYLQNVSKFDPLRTGLAFLPQEVTVFLAANLAGGIVTRYGTRRVLIGSIGVLGLGSLLYSQLPFDGGYAAIVLPGMLVSGFGLGALNVAGAIGATEGVPMAQHGIAAGVWNTGTQIGTALGLPLLTTVAAMRTNALSRAIEAGSAGDTSSTMAGTLGFARAMDSATVPMDSIAATVAGYKLAFVVAVGFALLGMLGVYAIGRKRS